MGGNIKGITIEFRGNATPLQKAIRQVDSELKKTDKELRQVQGALKFNPGNVDLWRQKQQLLTQKVDETTDKLDNLRQAQKQMDDAHVDKNSEEYRKLQREIIETESKLKTFEKQLKSIGNVKLHALGEQFKQVGAKMTAAGKTLTQKVTAPLALVGAASLKAGMDFDTAMSQVAATMGTTVDEIQELRDFAIEMGSTTAFSATQAAEGLNYMALAGYSADQSMAMLPTVLNLAAAGAMELGEASDMVTDAQTALGLSTEETTTMVDQMAKASSKSNTSVSQLGEAILKIGPTAKNLSGGTKELSTVLGLLADNGIKGSEAGTHLRNIMLALNPQTDKAAKAWDDLGVSAYDADGNLRPLEDTFGDLGKAMQGMTEEERTATITKMFNKTDLASVNALLDTTASRWQELGSAIDDSSGAASDMADTQLDNMQGSLTLLKSALEGAAISISDVLAPAVRTLADWITGLVDKFNNLSPQAQKFITIAGVIAAAIGPVLVIIGTLASSIGSIISLVGMIAPVITGAGAAIGGVAAGALLPIIGIIAAVVAAGILIYKNWDKIKAKALEIKESVAAAWQSLKEKITAIFTGIKNVLKTIWNAIKTVIQTYIKVIYALTIGRFKLMLSVAKTVFGALRTAVSNVWGKIRDAIKTPLQNAWEFVKKIIDKIRNFFPIKIGKIFSNLKLPKINVKGGKAPWGIGGKGTAPSFDVTWHAKGGIFDSPSIIGIGEAGAEAVVPLDKFWDKMDQMAAGTGDTFNFYITGDNPREIAAEVKRILIDETNRRKLAWQ